MNVIARSICIVTLVSTTAVAQDKAFSTSSGHAALHRKGSFVLVFRKQSIQRGPDFSARAAALEYQKAKHVRNLVWFSTSEGCFVNSDSNVIASLKETEKPQDQLAKEQDRVGGTNLALAQQLSREQARLTMHRDEIVWNLFDKLKDERHLSSVKCH